MSRPIPRPPISSHAHASLRLLPNLHAVEGMWTRFFPATRKIRKLVAEGAIGKVLSVSASLGFKSEPEFNERLFLPELAGGALFDVGIYPGQLVPSPAVYSRCSPLALCLP